MQRHLISPEAYKPLPTTSRSYVPVLQDLLGERTALSHASDPAWARMTPLLELVPRGAWSHQALKNHVREVSGVMEQHPCYVDFKKADPAGLVETTKGARPIAELAYEAARGRGLCFMPVAWTHSDDRHLGLVADAVDVDGHGLAIRHRVGGVARTGRTLNQQLTAVLDRVAVLPADVDLIIDLEYLDPDGLPATSWVAALLKSAVSLGPWRSVVLVATSVPPTFGRGLVAENSTKELPRQEWTLWRAVDEAVQFPVAFGDYGVQNPIPPPDPAPVGPWANIRYTHEGALLVARGENVRVTGPDQYLTLSRWVASHPSFDGPKLSYGDAEIARLAQQRVFAQSVPAAFEVDEDQVRASLSYWRGVGMSHHLEVVSRQLEQLA